MMLDVRDLHAFYGKSHILQGVSLCVGTGEIVSILGRNGVGRSTTLKAIMGDVPLKGSITFKGEAIAGLRSYEIAHRGLGYVPEDRAIFPTLTVEQNLNLGVKSGKKAARWGFGDTYRLFPRLEERANTPAGMISGGEQQMLTMCRTLMGDPDLIMIDEPTEGLAPQMVERVADLLQSIAERAHFYPLGGAKAHNGDAPLASCLCDGPRPYGVQRQSIRAHCRCGGAPSLAGSVGHLNRL